jgi:hypothetical protein
VTGFSGGKLDVELDMIRSPPDWAAIPPARRRERTMEAVGLVTALVAAVGVLAGTVMSVRSLPDIAHYRRLRRM